MNSFNTTNNTTTGSHANSKPYAKNAYVLTGHVIMSYSNDVSRAFNVPLSGPPRPQNPNVGPEGYYPPHPSVSYYEPHYRPEQYGSDTYTSYGRYNIAKYVPGDVLQMWHDLGQTVKETVAKLTGSGPDSSTPHNHIDNVQSRSQRDTENLDAGTHAVKEVNLRTVTAPN